MSRKSPGYIYALLLEESNIYVGYSSRPLGERLIEHFDNNGAEWTKLYPAKEVLHYKPGTKEDEDLLTLEMMKTYGWWKVRGGKWCCVDMKSCPQALLDYQNLNLPQKLNKSNSSIPSYNPNLKRDFDTFFDHISASMKEDGRQDNRIRSRCVRCGRDGHNANQCYAKFSIAGDVLSSSSDIYNFSTSSPTKKNSSWDHTRSINVCYRCGREGHYVNNCYATSSVDGFYLD